MVRSFRVEARSKDRMFVRLRAEIITEPGTLTKGELAMMKSKMATDLMIALSSAPHLNVEISDMKVTR